MCFGTKENVINHIKKDIEKGYLSKESEQEFIRCIEEIEKEYK